MLVFEKELFTIQIISSTLASPSGLSAIFASYNVSIGQSMIHWLQVFLLDQCSTAMSFRTCPYQVISTNIRSSCCTQGFILLAWHYHSFQKFLLQAIFEGKGFPSPSFSSGLRLFLNLQTTFLGNLTEY